MAQPDAEKAVSFLKRIKASSYRARFFCPERKVEIVFIGDNGRKRQVVCSYPLNDSIWGQEDDEILNNLNIRISDYWIFKYVEILERSNILFALAHEYKDNSTLLDFDL
jgi:hypothetical protein